MPKTTDGFSSKQERALAALLAGATIAAAAEAAGVHQSTITAWKKLPAFADALHEARRDVVSQVSGMLVQACTKAVATLTAILEDDQSPAAARVRAARTILDYAYKAMEMEDLAARLTKLEAALPGEQKPRTTVSPQTRVAQAEAQMISRKQAETQQRLLRISARLNWKDAGRFSMLFTQGYNADGIFDATRLSEEEQAELAHLEEQAAEDRSQQAVVPVQEEQPQEQERPELEQEQEQEVPAVVSEIFPPRPHIESFLQEVWQPTFWTIPEPLNLTAITPQQRYQFEHAVSRSAGLPGGIPGLYRRLRRRLGEVGQNPSPPLRKEIVETIHNLKPWWHGPVFDLFIKAIDDDYLKAS